MRKFITSIGPTNILVHSSDQLTSFDCKLDELKLGIKLLSFKRWGRLLQLQKRYTPFNSSHLELAKGLYQALALQEKQAAQKCFLLVFICLQGTMTKPYYLFTFCGLLLSPYPSIIYFPFISSLLNECFFSPRISLTTCQLIMRQH